MARPRCLESTMVVVMFLATFCVPGAAQAAGGADSKTDSQNVGSPEGWTVAYASLEPDYSSGQQTTRSGFGAYIRIIAINTDKTDTITDVPVNGVSLQETFAGKPLSDLTENDIHSHYMFKSPEFRTEGYPEPLAEAGKTLWYRILPGEANSALRWTEVLVRLRYYKGRPVGVTLHTEQGKRLEMNLKPPTESVNAYRIGLATANEWADTLYVYLLTPNTSVKLGSIRLDG